MESSKVTHLIKNAGVNSTGAIVAMPSYRESGRAIVVATIVGTNNGSDPALTVDVMGSIDGTHTVKIGTITLTGATGDTDYLGIDYPWPFLQVVASGAAGALTSFHARVAQ